MWADGRMLVEQSTRQLHDDSRRSPYDLNKAAESRD